MSNNEAEINLFEEIPLILSVTDKQGNIIPNAVLSNISFSQDSTIGEIIPDAHNPNLAIFKPTKAGVVHIVASATITIP